MSGGDLTGLTVSIAFFTDTVDAYKCNVILICVGTGGVARSKIGEGVATALGAVGRSRLTSDALVTA